jgi:hypothetical protein
MLILLDFNLELEIKGCASYIVHLKNLKIWRSTIYVLCVCIKKMVLKKNPFCLEIDL